MVPRSSPPLRSLTPCDCSWQGDPIHDKDPMQFHMETSLGENEFRAFHAVLRTRCVRHTHPTRFRRIWSTTSSSTDSETDTADDEHALRRSTAPSPTQQEQPAFTEPRPTAIPETFSTPLSREWDPPAPRPRPRWLRGSSVSPSGLHHSIAPPPDSNLVPHGCDKVDIDS